MQRAALHAPGGGSPAAAARIIRGGGSLCTCTCSSTSTTSSSARAAQQQRRVRCRSTDPAALQDVIVGGAVVSAVGAALFSGLKQEPVPCDLCAGNGGIKCFACSTSTTTSSGSSSSSSQPIDPDILSRDGSRSGSGVQRFARGLGSSSGKPGSCRVCKGKGLVLCSKCKGSGFMSTF